MSIKYLHDNHGCCSIEYNMLKDGLNYDAYVHSKKLLIAELTFTYTLLLA